jgi:V8-like Glu-specific endopeptidase
MKYAILRTIITGKGCGGWLDRVCQDLLNQTAQTAEATEVTEIEDLFAQSQSNVVKDIEEYLAKEKKQGRLLGAYLSIGDPDYQPIAFLERTLRLSASVCRITRKFSLKDLALLIEEWNSQDVPEMCKALEYFFKTPPEGTSWEKYWDKYKDQKFKKTFETPKMRERFSEREDEFLFVPYATGFLVGKSHILTNFHALNKLDHERFLDDFRVQFRYERNLNNRGIRPIEYKLKSVLSGDSDLDYTLFEIENFPDIEITRSENFSLEEEDFRRAKLRKLRLSFEKAGENFGWLRMSDQPIIPNISTAQIEEAENKLGSLKSEEKTLLEKAKLKGGIQGESLIIIQHPRGRAKEIVAFNSNILKVSESYIQYTTDTDFGSSGSPILNGDLQLIGLHFGALIEYKSENIEEINSEATSKSQNQKRSIIVKANIGTKIGAVVKHLRTVEKHEDIKKFVGEYIDGQCEVQRRIFILGGLKKNISGDTEFTQRLVKEMSKNLYEKRNQRNNEAGQTPQQNSKYRQVRIINALGDIKLFSRELDGDGEAPKNQKIEFHKLQISSDPQLPLKMAIAWINTVCDLGDSDDSRAYRPGDVALQLVTEKYDSEELQLKLRQLKRRSLIEQESDPLPRGMLVYHVSDNRERRSHAELILDRLSEGIPTLRSRGALSDSTSPEGRHTFCRDLYMPSLVVNLGFLEHPLDQQVLGANEEKIFDEDKMKQLANELVEAVIAWSDALNPGSFSPD